jgi:hypothetical protein
VDFLDDDAPAKTPSRDVSAPPPHRRPDRRRTRIQRILILAAILFVVVFALALWARSCQHSRKVSSYRTYFDSVATDISQSNDLGKQLDQIITNPTQLQRAQLVTKLGDLTGQQKGIAVRAARLQPPSTLDGEQAVFADGMKVRAEGFQLFQTTLLGALTSKKVGAGKLAALGGYFTGPDAYYMIQVYTQARNTLSGQGVTGVEVPPSTYYLTSGMFDTTKLTAMLSSIGSSAKLSGIHGVGLAGVTAQPGNIALSRGQVTNVPATADLSFEVKVQNMGNVTEKNVPVTAELDLPNGSVLTQAGTINTIGASQYQAVSITGFAIPADALSKVSTLKVKAGPVPGERVLSNNSGQYKILLQLK